MPESGSTGKGDLKRAVPVLDLQGQVVFLLLTVL